MDNAVEIQRLRCRAVVQAAADEAEVAEAVAAGGSAGGGGNNNNNNNNKTKKSPRTDGSTWRYNPTSDRLRTDLLTSSTEYDEIVKRILDKEDAECIAPYVVGIGRDEETEEMVGLDKREIYLWLAFANSTPRSNVRRPTITLADCTRRTKH